MGRMGNRMVLLYVYNMCSIVYVVVVAILGVTRQSASLVSPDGAPIRALAILGVIHKLHLAINHARAAALAFKPGHVKPKRTRRDVIARNHHAASRVYEGDFLAHHGPSLAARLQRCEKVRGVVRPFEVARDELGDESVDVVAQGQGGEFGEPGAEVGVRRRRRTASDDARARRRRRRRRHDDDDDDVFVGWFVDRSRRTGRVCVMLMKRRRHGARASESGGGGRRRGRRRMANGEWRARGGCDARG